ncbi:hypothetical protein Z969_10670 [Clostridium novyi A str. 4570]|uniref:DarT domain-containing protein n=2 Tax=Clostridium novyi TaxID=1542 RepID=A0AA89CQH7_CLONO|nr:hypothetical protein Z969_10670 [Clostridium novyi A str. 4570]
MIKILYFLMEMLQILILVILFDFFNNMDWKYIFHNTWFNPEERNYIINKRQAELLSKKSVSLKYLKKIIFRSNADFRQAIRVWGKNNIFCVNEKYFSKKDKLPITDWRYNNYIDDYDMIYSFNNLNLIIYFKKPLKDYTISLGVLDICGQDKTSLVMDKLKYNLTNKYGINCEWGDSTKINFNFCNNLSNGDIIYIYINGVPCIEETIMYKK